MEDVGQGLEKPATTPRGRALLGLGLPARCGQDAEPDSRTGRRVGQQVSSWESRDKSSGGRSGLKKPVVGLLERVGYGDTNILALCCVTDQ